MRPNFMIVAFVCLISLLSGLLQASDYKVPNSWELIAKSQGAEITDFAIKGNWVVWFEKELDPKSAQAMTQSFFAKIFRKNIETNAFDIVYESKLSLVSDHFVLGPNGIIYYYDRDKSRQSLNIPGQNESYIFPVANDLKEGQYSPPIFYYPVKIYNYALLCQISQGAKTGISIVPFDGRKLDFENKFLVSEHVQVTRDTYLFWNNKNLFYTTGSNWYSPVELFNVEENKTIWSVEKKDNLGIIPIGLTNDYAYYCVQSKFYIDAGERKTTGGYKKFIDKIFRRSTKQIDKVEVLNLPLQLPCLIDFYPERLLGIIKVKDKFVLAELNFNTGFMSKYDIILPDPLGIESHEKFSDLIDVGEASKIREGLHSSGLRLPDLRLFSVTGDAESGQLIVLLNNNIYKVPKTQSEKIAGYVWKPVNEEDMK